LSPGIIWASAGLSRSDLGSGRVAWGPQLSGTVWRWPYHGLVHPRRTEVLGCSGGLLPRPKRCCCCCVSGLCCAVCALGRWWGWR